MRLILLDVRAEEKAKGGWRAARGLGRERFIVQMDGDPIAIDTFDDLCTSAASPASVAAAAAPASRGLGEAGDGTDGEVILVQEIDAPEGAYRIVGVVRDRLAGAVGAGTAELQIHSAGTATGSAAPFVAAPGATVLEGHPLAPEGSDDEPGKRQIRAASRRPL